MKVLDRAIKVGKSLNISADIQGNLSDPVTLATVTSQSPAIVSVSNVDYINNPITMTLTGASVGTTVVTVDYESANESDCQSFIVNVEGC